MHHFHSSNPEKLSLLWPVASVIFASVTQRLSSQDAELPSEVLCWTILPLISWISRNTGLKSCSVGSSDLGDGISKVVAPIKPSSSALATVALSVGAASLAASEFKSQALLPALPPLILLIQRRLHSDSRSPRTRGFSVNLIESPVMAAAIALFSIITLSKGDLLAALTSVPALLGFLAVYATLTLRATPRSTSHPGFDVEDAILALSIRAVVVAAVFLLVRCLFLGAGWPGLFSVLALGAAKACLWYSLIMTSKNSSWMVAPVVKLFSITSSIDFMSLTTESQAISLVLSSVLSLGQLAGLLPQHTKSRHIVLLLLLFAVFPYLINIWSLSASYSHAPNWDTGELHPVDRLIEDAQQQFQQMRKRQSITHSIAQEEYRRRYGIDPPPGFEGWFEYAVSHRSPIIDEFDAVFESISPFLQLSGKQVKEVMRSIHERPLNELWTCLFQGEDAKASCHHRKRSVAKDRDITLLFNQLLGDVGSQLKDIKALVNHLDEPRVVYPPRSTPDGVFSMRNLKREPTWADVTAYCPSDLEDWNAKHPMVQQYGLPFVTNRTSVMDLCQHPEYEHMHGLLISPKNLRIVEGHVPILSTGSFSTMGDILIPSPAYIQAPFQYDDHGDVPWEKKRNNLYWDGSNTGGYAKEDDPWLQFHRQRFVSFVQRLEDRSYYYLQSFGGKVLKTASKLLDGRHYDVAFTRILQCQESVCREQRNFFRRRTYTPATAALHSRLVFDLDGNGISGRFYRLLASHSLPLKQTLFREWHDERLVPWVHYVPISQGMEELPEVVRWLTTTERGQMRAREMAEAGRRWYYEAIRDVDKGIYLYRVMLELGRMQDEKREARAS